MYVLYLIVTNSSLVTENSKERLKNLLWLINTLPNINRVILNKLFEWFSFISVKADNVEAKMEEIADTFSDPLFKPQLFDDESDTYVPTIKKLICTLMENFHYLFSVRTL
jgi:hypothetical protein